MFNRLFSMIGYSVAPSGRGVVDAVTRLDVAPPSCPAYAPNGNSRDLALYYEEPTYGSTISIGYQSQFEYHDGNCGTVWVNSGDPVWYEYGSYAGYIDSVSTITVCSSDYTAYTFRLNFYSDGLGGAYTNESNVSYTPYGTFYAFCGDYEYYADGAGSTYSVYIDPNAGGGGGCDPYGTQISGTNSDAYIYISEVGSNVIAGTSYNNEYADGNCGSYSESGTTWYSAGTVLYDSGSVQYIANGDGTYYQYDPNAGGGGGGGCDSYGTYLGSYSGNSEIYMSEPFYNGYVVVGSVSYDNYADGNCGTYSDGVLYTWYSYGTLLVTGNDGTGDYAAYSDGNGGYYVELYNP